MSAPFTYIFFSYSTQIYNHIVLIRHNKQTKRRRKKRDTNVFGIYLKKIKAQTKTSTSARQNQQQLFMKNGVRAFKKMQQRYKIFRK